MIVISLPGGVVLHIGVGRSPTPMCKTIPQEGYITCYLGNITVEEIWATFLDVAHMASYIYGLITMFLTV